MTGVPVIEHVLIQLGRTDEEQEMVQCYITHVQDGEESKRGGGGGYPPIHKSESLLFPKTIFPPLVYFYTLLP